MDFGALLKTPLPKFVQLPKRVYLKIEKRRNHPAAYLTTGSDLTALDASRGGDRW